MKSHFKYYGTFNIIHILDAEARICQDLKSYLFYITSVDCGPCHHCWCVCTPMCDACMFWFDWVMTLTDCVTGKQMIAEIWMPLVSFHCALSAHTSIMLSVYAPDIDRVYVQHAWGYPLLCFNSLSTEAAGNVPSHLVRMRLFCMSPCRTEQNRNRSPLEAETLCFSNTQVQRHYQAPR